MDKVTDPSKIVTDELVLRRIAEQDMDKDYWEFWHDYAPRSKEYSPYAKFYRDLKSNKRIMVVSGLPMVKPDGAKIEIGWLKQGDKYVSKPNLFSAVVENGQIRVTCLSDQPNGRKAGDWVQWKPQLYLDDVEQTRGDVVLLTTDPINPDLHGNTLEWDYGFCKRRIRVIQGRIWEKWFPNPSAFTLDPDALVKIKHNHTGNMSLKLGEYAVGDDEEVFSIRAFGTPDEPLTIGASPETFYPDAHTETNSVDGNTRDSANNLTWANMITEPGDWADDVDTNMQHCYIFASTTTNRWQTIHHALIVLYVAGLPDALNVTDVVFSVFGNFKRDELGIAPDTNVFAANPASNTAITGTDFSTVTDTAYSTAITYAGFSASSYNDFTFNAAGIAAVQTAAEGNTVVKLGMKNANYEVTGTPPSWTSAKISSMRVYQADYGSNKPKLVVTYIVITAQAVGSGSIAIVGDLGRKVLIGVGAASMTIVGALASIFTQFISVGGGAVSIVGKSLRNCFFPNNAGASRSTRFVGKRRFWGRYR